MLKSLLGSADTAHQLSTAARYHALNHVPVQLPTESAEAAKLLVCGLFSGVKAMKKRLTADTAVEVMLLADKLDVRVVAEAAAKYVARKSCLDVAQLVPVWEACMRHRTAGTVWDVVRAAVVNELNECDCGACGDDDEELCVLTKCDLSRLSWAALMDLLVALPPDRAEDAPIETFEWSVPNAANYENEEECECHKGLSINATDGVSFGFDVDVYPRGDDVNDPGEVS